MASNSRDLHVNIDGNAQGADKAFLSAKESAEVFEKELQRLERQQAMQEESLRRAKAATEAYGKANSDSAEKARRFGLAAAEAGERAAKSQDKAREASDKLAAGEITAKEAAEAQAKALRDVERAALTSAAAQRAAAKAAEDEAKQEAQAARDAVVAAGAERLAHLKAAGAVKEHNALLRNLRKDYKEFDKGFQEMQTIATRAFGLLNKGANAAMSGIQAGMNALAEMGPLLLVGIVAALAALPVLAVAAAGALTLGLGGALTVIAVKAAASSQRVKDAFAALGSDASSAAHDWAQPWVGSLESVVQHARTTLAQLSPTFRQTFANMAPVFQSFMTQLEDSLVQLGPAISSVGANFDKLLVKLGPALPGIMSNVANGIMLIAQTAGDHATEITFFAQAIGVLIDGIGKLVSALAYVQPIVSPLYDAFKSLGLGAGGSKAPIASLSQGFSQLGQSASTAKDEVTALDDAIKGILDPSLAVYNDTTKLKQGFADLAKALKASKGSLSDNTEASRAARDAFATQISTVAKLASEQVKLTGKTADGKRVVEQWIGTLLKAAGADGDAQRQVAALAAAFGIKLPPMASRGKMSVADLKKTIDSLKNKTVKVGADTSAARAALQRLLDMESRVQQGVPSANLAKGGLTPGYAAGGLAGFPGGGMIHGAGSTTSDSNLIAVSDREFVVNAKETAKWLPLLSEINSGKLSATKNTYLGASAKSSYLPAAPLGSSTNGSKISASGVHVSRITAGHGTGSKGAATSVLHGSTGSGGGGGAAGKLDITLHFAAPAGGGLMGQIVKNLRVDVRTEGGGSAQVFFAGKA